MCAHSDSFKERMERALPAGALEVTRCSQCDCALWYRSTAQAEIAVHVVAMLAVAHPTLLETLFWRQKSRTRRQPPHGQGPNLVLRWQSAGFPDGCIDCGTYDTAHVAHGRCQTCDNNWRYARRSTTPTDDL